MSVREWGPPGRWELNHSGLVSSADDGRTWQVHPELRWPSSSGFGQVVMVESAGQVYLFGNPRWAVRRGAAGFLMLYLNEERAAIVLRTAPQLQGPWDGERVVMTAADHPALYAPYLLAGTDPGRDVVFTMSKFGPYQVFLARLTLEAVGG